MTIWLDDVILDHFKEHGGRVGKGYQTLINDALRDAIGEGALTPKVVREGLKVETDAGRAPRRIQIGKTGHLTKHPPHVGGVIHREVMEPLGLMVTQAARSLGVGRQALSSLLNEKAALSSDMALRIKKAFGPKIRCWK